MSARRRFLSPRSPYPYLGLAAVGLGWWAQTVYGGINSQKAHSGIFKAVLFHLRHDEAAQSLLGDNIQHDPKRHPSVKGTVNMLKGKADIEFLVEGSKGTGLVRFRGVRGEDDWTSQVFTLRSPEGKTVEYP
ncbi:hypothetical protein SpCBS45565_g03857 [Spizellomyces sp. 'palustris']|nr:hypothetical protein SpCBS45565_g03857 [Spizellomyces sp. 'palustris']